MPSGFEKVQRKLRAEDRGEGKVFVDKPDADERIKSHMTGMAIGSAALPSDAVSLANETSQFVKNDELLSALFPNLANAADGLKTINEFVGRPGFEELIKAMGIKSDPKNPDQIAGEMMSPAFYGPAAKTVAKLSKDDSCQLTRDKFQLDDADLLLEQINPDLLNPFRENPYTHSLASASMA